MMYGFALCAVALGFLVGMVFLHLQAGNYGQAFFNGVGIVVALLLALRLYREG